MKEDTNISATHEGLADAGLDVGVSRRALSLARVVDRLPPGEYLIRLKRSPFKTRPWQVEVLRGERLWAREVE
ncbi:MAG: hypothetical protein OEY93_00550 [Anaerolineae bacterium]|nr:hypothetical protein [Anaerolineae bacterium]